MNRRGFLGSLIGLAAAPDIVRAESLMRIIVPAGLILWGDGVHDDAPALNAYWSGRRAQRPDGSVLVARGDVYLIPKGTYAIGSTLVLTERGQIFDSLIIALPRLGDKPMLYVPNTAGWNKTEKPRVNNNYFIGTATPRSTALVFDELEP